METTYTNYEVIDYVYQHSRYHGNLMVMCQRLAEEENGHITLITLMNIAEMIFKDRTGNYDDGFFLVIENLKKNNLINDVEYEFLNSPINGVRKIRNLLAHANLSKYSIKFLNEKEDVLYPLTENDTCLKLYKAFSTIIFNIILRLIGDDLIIDIDPCVDELIKAIEIIIVETTPEQLLEYKGIDYNEIDIWSTFSEETKYRIAENASDVNVLSMILKNLLDYN